MFLVQPRWAGVNVKNCYKEFVSEFDTLPESSVIWEPYSPAMLDARAPNGGVSALCYRDQALWLTKEKLVFDVYVHDHSPQRVMRQFGLYQEFPPPTGDLVDKRTQR
jgi:hypothetical protein